MADTNYIASIVKILEKPISIVLNDKIVTTEFRVQMPQIQNSRIVRLVFWGNLALDVAKYYQINDYIMIEGYLSLHNKLMNNNVKKRKWKKISINVFKFYYLNKKA